jgi:hypothetical protein
LRIPSLNGYCGLFLKGKDSVKNDSKMWSSSQIQFPTISIDEYVQSAIRFINIDDNDKCIWLDKQWSRLLRSLPTGPPALAVVDLDIGISQSNLYSSLGYACIIAEKMKLNRIILAGSLPICVDVSQCNGFISMIRLLIPHCVSRCNSNLSASLDCITDGLRYVFETPFRIFIFSEKFSFKWNTLLDIVSSTTSTIVSGIEVIFWNMNSSFKIPDDLYLEQTYYHDDSSSHYWNLVPQLQHDNMRKFTYMSGYNIGLLTPFFSYEPFIFDKWLLNQYPEWNSYFDVFIENLSDLTIGQCC